MIDMKYLKWTLVPPFILMGLLFISAVAYIYSPRLAAMSIGPEAGPKPCEQAIPDGNVTLNQSEMKLRQAVAETCESTKSLIGIAVLTMAVLTIAFGMIPMIIITLDILQSDMAKNRKIAWLGVTWLLLGFFAAILYYFIEKKGD
jgi:hypothetical protein